METSPKLSQQVGSCYSSSTGSISGPTYP